MDMKRFFRKNAATLLAAISIPTGVGLAAHGAMTQTEKPAKQSAIATDAVLISDQHQTPVNLGGEAGFGLGLVVLGALGLGSKKLEQVFSHSASDAVNAGNPGADQQPVAKKKIEGLVR